MKQKTIDGFSYIKASSTRRKVLLALEDNVLMPSEISKLIHVSPPHTSRALRDLEDKELILCLNPDIRVGKLFILTDFGKEVLKCVKKYIEKR